MTDEHPSVTIPTIDGTLTSPNTIPDDTPDEMTLPQQLQWCKAMLHIHGLLTEREKEKVDERFHKRWHIAVRRPFATAIRKRGQQ